IGVEATPRSSSGTRPGYAEELRACELPARLPEHAHVDSLRDNLDRAWPRLRPGSVLAARGFTVFFWAAGLVAVLIARADLSLAEFPRRILSQATLDGVSIAARISLYFRCLLFFVAAVVSLVWIVPRAGRLVGEKQLHVLELTSVCGALLL